MAPEKAPPRRPVTRNDVARYAGVSSAVVSYVINDGPKRVAPATALKVRNAVEVLGYRPNLAAKALSSGSTQMLGLVLTEWTNPFFAEFAQAIERAAAARGHAILMSHSDGNANTEIQRLAELEARQVDGLLVVSLLSEAQLALALQSRPGRRSVPTVLLNRTTPVSGFSVVGADFAGGSRAAAEHLIQVHGHRRIGLVTGSDLHTPLEPREQGWHDALDAAGMRRGKVGRGNYTRESGYEIARRLLSARWPPTAIFAVSDLMAVGVLHAAHELGLRVPDDLAIISFDGSAESQFSWPPLTAVRQPVEAMAVEAVTRVLDTGDSNDHVRVFPTELITRQSCGCV